MEKVDIMFSIPAHEKAEVLLDTIINFKFYNPDCGIIIHISCEFDWKTSAIKENDFFDIISKMSYVWINPKRLRSRKDMLSEIHLLNFDYIQSVCEFDYFSLMASNCAFIRKGLSQFMYEGGYIAAFDYFDIRKKDSWEWSVCLKDVQYNNLLQGISAVGTYGGQVEGSIYQYSLFKKVSEAIEKYFKFDLMTERYQSEEILFITIAVNYLAETNQLGLLYDDTCIYMDWHMGLRVFILKISSYQKKYFGIKRVPRDINADMRIYLRDYTGGRYSWILSTYVNNLQHKSLLRLRVVDTLKYLIELAKCGVKSVIYHKQFKRTGR